MTFPGSIDTRPSRLVLIRHGESLRNQLKGKSTYFEDEETRDLLAGVADQDVQLTQRGSDQAILTGQGLLRNLGVPDYIYHSGYRRTYDTALGILSAFSKEDIENTIKLRMNHLLRERDSGYTHGMTTAEAERHFPWLKSYWKTFGGFMARPPGGESLADVANRVQIFLDMIYRRRARQTVFVVTHGGTIRCFRFLLEHQDYNQVTDITPENVSPNCGVTVYEFDPGSGTMLLKQSGLTYWK